MRNRFVFLVVGIILGSAPTYYFFSSTRNQSGSPTTAETTEAETKSDQAICPTCPVCPDEENSQPLPPPKFAANTPEILKTNSEGEAMVAWEAVPGASAYRIFIIDKNEMVIKTNRARGLRLYLKDFPKPEGIETIEYQIAIATLNGNGGEGPRGEKKRIIVTKKAPIKAPKIRTIRIED